MCAYVSERHRDASNKITVVCNIPHNRFTSKFKITRSIWRVGMPAATEIMRWLACTTDTTSLSTSETMWGLTAMTTTSLLRTTSQLSALVWIPSAYRQRQGIHHDNYTAVNASVWNKLQCWFIDVEHITPRIACSGKFRQLQKTVNNSLF